MASMIFRRVYRVLLLVANGLAVALVLGVLALFTFVALTLAR